MKGKKAIIAGLIVVLIAAVAAKLLFFPSIKDAYFATPGFRGLQAPSGLVVLRPTHYPFLRHTGPMYASSPHSRTNFWIVGRNAPLTDVFAAAYSQNPSRIILPADAPKDNFDFLITVDSRPREQLQAAIRRKLGYQAHVELREAEVLALKVVNPAPPGLTISDAGAHRRTRFDGGKYQFTSMPISIVPQFLRQFSGLIVVDKTGLTNLYDYSLPMPGVAQRQSSTNDGPRERAQQIIKDLGLGLEPEMEPGEVLVATKTPTATPIPPDKTQMLLGPQNSGAEEGSEHWYHGMDGNGVLLTDNTDAASGDNDFTVENTSTNGHNNAEWRCETFSLGPATNGARPVRFSFDYKLPGSVNDGDNIRVQLRFFDQNTNYMSQQVFWVGSSSHDSAMTSYKTVASGDILPPSGSRRCDVTLSANLYEPDHWSSGIGRFDNIFVTTEAAPRH